MSYQKVIVANTADNPVPITGGGSGGSDELLQEISAKLTILINVIDLRLTAILTATDGTKNQLGILNMKWQESVDGTNPLWCHRDKIRVGFRNFARPGTSVGNASWNQRMPEASYAQPALNGFHVRAINPVYTAPNLATNNAGESYFSDESLDSCAAPLVINYATVVKHTNDPSGLVQKNLSCSMQIGDDNTSTGTRPPGIVAIAKPSVSVENVVNANGPFTELRVTGLLKGPDDMPKFEIVCDCEKCADCLKIKS